MKRATAATLLALMILPMSCVTGRQEAAAILDQFETGAFDPPASTLAAFRVALDTNPDVQRLLQLHDGAPAAHERMNRGVAAVGDRMAAICSYVIEKRAYRAAVPTLEAYLRSSPGLQHHSWGPNFAVRALLVLKAIPDATDGYQPYDDATIRRAISAP